MARNKKGGRGQKRGMATDHVVKQKKKKLDHGSKAPSQGAGDKGPAGDGGHNIHREADHCQKEAHPRNLTSNPQALKNAEEQALHNSGQQKSYLILTADEDIGPYKDFEGLSEADICHLPECSSELLLHSYLPILNTRSYLSVVVIVGAEDVKQGLSSNVTQKSINSIVKQLHHRICHVQPSFICSLPEENSSLVKSINARHWTGIFDPQPVKFYGREYIKMGNINPEALRNICQLNAMSRERSPALVIAATEGQHLCVDEDFSHDTCYLPKCTAELLYKAYLPLINTSPYRHIILIVGWEDCCQRVDIKVTKHYLLRCLTDLKKRWKNKWRTIIELIPVLTNADEAKYGETLYILVKKDCSGFRYLHLTKECSESLDQDGSLTESGLTSLREHLTSRIAEIKELLGKDYLRKQGYSEKEIEEGVDRTAGKNVEKNADESKPVIPNPVALENAKNNTALNEGKASTGCLVITCRRDSFLEEYNLSQHSVCFLPEVTLELLSTAYLPVLDTSTFRTVMIILDGENEGSPEYMNKYMREIVHILRERSPGVQLTYISLHNRPHDPAAIFFETDRPFKPMKSLGGYQLMNLDELNPTALRIAANNLNRKVTESSCLVLMLGQDIELYEQNTFNHAVCYLKCTPLQLHRVYLPLIDTRPFSSVVVIVGDSSLEKGVSDKWNMHNMLCTMSQVAQRKAPTRIIFVNATGQFPELGKKVKWLRFIPSFPRHVRYVDLGVKASQVKVTELRKMVSDAIKNHHKMYSDRTPCPPDNAQLPVGSLNEES